jgi:hypothetical protein
MLMRIIALMKAWAIAGPGVRFAAFDLSAGTSDLNGQALKVQPTLAPVTADAGSCEHAARCRSQSRRRLDPTAELLHGPSPETRSADLSRALHLLPQEIAQ